MSGNILVDMEIGADGRCPVAGTSEAVESTISDIARTAYLSENPPPLEQFVVESDEQLDRDELETVFEFDSGHVYQFERTDRQSCVCEIIERYGCPVSNLSARDGTLSVSFYSPTLKVMQQIVHELSEWYSDINIKKLTRYDERAETDLTWVDRNLLTDRQREVVKTSIDEGYFDYPRRANAGEVAEKMDLATSTFIQHLVTAQRKIFNSLFR